jgi:CRP-like cAMP-binding protein
MAKIIEAQILKLYTPFSEFKDLGTINEALESGQSISMSEGHILFKRDEHDEYCYWLISGSLDLLDENFDVVKVQATEESSWHPMDNKSPHKLTAVSTSDSLIFKLKRSILHLIKNPTMSSDYMVSSVTEADEVDSDWMSSMLSSPLFDFLPPGNIQELFNRFEEKSYKQGEIVILQGEVGDYFYVIQKGRTKVEYNTGDSSILLATLDKGAFFGEDALISNVPRNASITMLTSGVLMRLSEKDFTSLLYAPLIEKMDPKEAKNMIAAADPLTRILDVRTRQEFQAGGLKGSINIPVLSLRQHLDKLDQKTIYVVRSDGDKRCEIAAHVLNGKGYTAYVLNEGPW